MRKVGGPTLRFFIDRLMGPKACNTCKASNTCITCLTGITCNTFLTRLVRKVLQYVLTLERASRSKRTGQWRYYAFDQAGALMKFGSRAARLGGWCIGRKNVAFHGPFRVSCAKGGAQPGAAMFHPSRLPTALRCCVPRAGANRNLPYCLIPLA